MLKLKDLYQFEEEGINEPLIYFDNFYEFIRDKLTIGDKNLRKDNVVREIKGHKEGIKNLSHGKALTTSSLVRFIFNHCEDYKICHDISIDITTCFFTNKSQEYTKTLLGLYKSIVKNDFSCYQETSAFRDETVPTLNHDYRSMFIDNEWDKILLFENHYFNHVAVQDEDFETAVKRKWELFHYLTAVNGMCKTWTNNTKATIKRRISRQKSFEMTQNIEVHGKQSHFPVVIESELMKNLDLMWPDCVTNIVCVDTNLSKSTNSLTIILLCKDNIQLRDISSYVARFLNARHLVNVSKIMFLFQDVFQHYIQKNNQIARFHLRDDIFTGKLKDCVFHIETPTPVFIPGNDHDKCETCHTTSLPKPLGIKSFSVLQEWYLDVPLDIQILMQTFINRESYRRSKDDDNFLSTKLERLYQLYDAMLNTYNRNYIGLLQQANTDELAMHFKSVGTVFSITSTSGITSSLVQAERKIKERTVDDLCYYNTYLKMYPLKYETKEGDIERSLNLQQCHLILMMDNLVRLTTYADPNPGESRTGQVCTLPLTIQGLPRDSIVTEKWHLENCSRGENCLCKRTTALTKNDFDLVIGSLTQEEKDVWERFNKVLNWGNCALWRRIKETNLLDIGSSNTIQGIDGEEYKDEDEDNDEIEDNISNMMDLEFDDLELLNADSEISNINADLENSENEQLVEEENLGSLIETAKLLSSTSRLLHIEMDDHDMSGITELDTRPEIDENELELSFGNMSLDNEGRDNNNSNYSTDEGNILSEFGLEKYKVPPLLCRHPPPATGRDDDICKLKEIMDDMLVKTGRINTFDESVDRILFGPDNKIGANLLKVVKEQKYKHFLPEFPLLHLRKSKINTLFSAYKDAGLLHLLMFMCDEDKKEWSKLVTMEHIDVATRYVRRLSLSFHIAFICRFMQCISHPEAISIINMLEEGNIVEMCDLWNDRFQEFMEVGCNQNCTFALHADMMQHCDEVVAVYLSERLGGNIGYTLLLAAVKQSLPFSFLNGATSYGPYCTQLLIEHYSAGYFHQCLKKTLYTTPIGNSTVNFACDSKREMDHQDALRGFRSGSSMTSVIGRMSLIDSLNETCQLRSKIKTDTKEDSNVEWKLTETDLNHVIPTASLILRRKGLCLEETDYPENVYSSDKSILSPCILDSSTDNIGKFLIKRFLSNNNLLGMTPDDIPNIKEVTGPSSLIAKVKRSKGVTMKRTSEKAAFQAKSERQVKEEKRKASVKREMQRANLLSSEMNMCQALVKPDCTKPKVMKSKGMQQALVKLLQELKCQKNVISLNQKSVPKDISDIVQLLTVEFAGVKFKTKVTSGTQYIKYVQNAVIKPLIQQFPALDRIILCEEKYSFTPDTFKAATHQQRTVKQRQTIAHLRKPDEMLNDERFRKEDIVTTREGKTIMSTYLAANATSLEIDADIIIDIDSEFHLKKIQCEHSRDCNCKYFTIPTRCLFQKSCPMPVIQDLTDMPQRKGEAEMSQVDWLCISHTTLTPRKAACSIVTSGDIDAIPIHMFALSNNWPVSDGKHLYPIYVVLQKPNKTVDVYNISALIEFFQHNFDDVDIVKKISIVLCMGGNDFIPKFYGISHEKVLNLFLYNDFFRVNLLKKNDRDIYQVDIETYKMFMKTLYCPKTIRPDSSYQDVRRGTMFVKRKQEKEKSDLIYSRCLRSGQLWLPPESAIDRIADIINLQIEYLSTAGHPMDGLPNFLKYDCLQKLESGDIIYYFGPDAKGNINTIIGQKRLQEETPQKGRRKKRVATSTPIK